MSILSKNIIDKPHLSPDEISRVPFNVVHDEKGNVKFSVPTLCPDFKKTWYAHRWNNMY